MKTQQTSGVMNMSLQWTYQLSQQKNPAVSLHVWLQPSWWDAYWDCQFYNQGIVSPTHPFAPLISLTLTWHSAASVVTNIKGLIWWGWIVGFMLAVWKCKSAFHSIHVSAKVLNLAQEPPKQTRGEILREITCCLFCYFSFILQWGYWISV